MVIQVFQDLAQTVFVMLVSIGIEGLYEVKVFRDLALKNILVS